MSSQRAWPALPQLLVWSQGSGQRSVLQLLLPLQRGVGMPVCVVRVPPCGQTVLLAPDSWRFPSPHSLQHHKLWESPCKDGRGFPKEQMVGATLHQEKRGLRIKPRPRPPHLRGSSVGAPEGPSFQGVGGEPVLSSESVV